MSSPRLIIQGVLPGFPPKPSRPLKFRRVPDVHISLTRLLNGDMAAWDPAWALITIGTGYLLLFAAQDQGIKLISPVEPHHVETHIQRLTAYLAALRTSPPADADFATVSGWKKRYEREIGNLQRALHVLAYRDSDTAGRDRRPRIYHVLPFRSRVDPVRKEPPRLETYLIQDNGALTGKKGQPSAYVLLSDARSGHELVRLNDPHTKNVSESQVETFDTCGRLWTRDLAKAKQMLHHFWRIHPKDGLDKKQAATEHLETVLSGNEKAPPPEPMPSEQAAPSPV